MVSTFVLTYVWALLDFDWSKQQSSQEEEQQQQQQQHLPFTYQPGSYPKRIPFLL